MKKRIPSRFVYFLQEIAIVVLGVLIAVSISNYKEKAENADYVAKTLLAIENEIKSSQIEVDTVLNRHIKLYEILENNATDNEHSLAELISSAGGFQAASVKNVSLRFFISNKAELLEFQMISQLLDIEMAADVLTDKINRLSDFAYANVHETDEQVKVKFTYLIANVIDGEQTLLESYAHFLDENKIYLEGEDN
jgi:hypothetical protein